MYPKTITYKDFNGINRTETFYFNLTDIELAEYIADLNKNGMNIEEIMKDAQAQVEANKDAENNATAMLSETANILYAFKQLILRAYGEKSGDGRYFNKLDLDGHKLSIPFSQSAAYYQLLNDITASPDTAQEFMSSIIPESLATAVKEAQAGNIAPANGIQLVSAT